MFEWSDAEVFFSQNATWLSQAPQDAAPVVRNS